MDELKQSNFAPKKVLEKENGQLKTTIEDISAQNDNLRFQVLDIQEFLETIQIDGISALDLYRQQKKMIEKESKVSHD